MRKNLLIVISFITSLTFATDTKANSSNDSRIGNTSVGYQVFNHDTKYALNSVKRAAETAQYENDSMQSMRGEILFSNDKIRISSVYPNPASAYASIDYHLLKDTDNAKIVLCNVLGNVVGEYSLIRDAKTLHISTLELNSGVYFYTLSVDGKSLVTRKLIIKHNS